MKKAIVILFLVSYLFSTTELSQLLKTPVLVSHFIEHKEENKEISLWKFLCIHYAHGEVMDDDHDKDMKLPFKTHDNCSNQIVIAVPPTIQIVLGKRIEIFSKKEKQLFAIHQIITSYNSSIWQPPRFC